MGKPSKQNKKSTTHTNAKEYVILAVLGDMEQAMDYKSLLEANDIPVIINEQKDESAEESISVMVPEEYLDEAHVVIESQDAYDDFYDLALDEEGDADFEDDYFDDDF